MTRLPTLVVLALAVAPGALHAQAFPVDREHVLQGRAVFQIVQAGDSVGSMTVEAAFRDDIYVVRDRSIMLPQADEEMILRFDAESFEPRTAWVIARFGATDIRNHFTFADGHVSGWAYVHQEGTEARDLVVQTELPAHAMLRGGVIFLAQAAPLAVGERVSVPWFSSISGAVEHVTLTATGTETVTVPAGTFETTRLALEGGTPENVIYVSNEVPRRMVRVEVVGQDMTIDLLR